MATTYVLGLGNVLMGDDGFGPSVVRAFDEQYAVTGDVEVVDLGTPGLDLTPWFADAGHVIIVDTVKAALPPGTVRQYEKADLIKHAPFARIGPHDPGVKETVLTLDFAGRGPQAVTIVGVVPAHVGYGTELSAPVAAAGPAAIDALVAVLQRSGFDPRPRVQAPSGTRPAGAWWTTNA